MDTQALKAFLAVADSGSFSIAAERLFITQSAVSKRIQQLEQQLGTDLFHRHNRTISLTDAGQTLFPQAETILDLIHDSELAIANLKGAVCGELHIATSHHIGLHRLPATLQQFVQTFPQAQLKLNFMGSEGAYRAVQNRQVELALTTLDEASIESDDDTSIMAETLWRDDLICVCSPNHSLADEQPVTLARLAEHPAILPETHTVTYQLIANAFQQQQLTVKNPMPTNYLETIKMMATVGIGWTMLPANMVDNQLHKIAWPAKPIQRQLGIIYLRQRTLSNAASALIALLRKK